MRTAFLPADIMLPNESVDMTRWSVIACDQYTSEPEYWEKVKEIAGDGPSALSMIFPEVYLEDEDKEERLKSIHQAMRDYQDRGIFRELKQAMIYVRRINSSGNLQEGDLLAMPSISADVLTALGLDPSEYLSRESRR